MVGKGVEQLTVKLMRKMEVSTPFVWCCDLFSTCFLVFTHPLSIFPARVSALETSGDAQGPSERRSRQTGRGEANPAVFASIVSLDVPRSFQDVDLSLEWMLYGYQIIAYIIYYYIMFYYDIIILLQYHCTIILYYNTLQYIMIYYILSYYITEYYITLCCILQW